MRIASVKMKMYPQIYFGLFVVVSVIKPGISRPFAIIAYKECVLNGSPVEQSEPFDLTPCMTCVCTDKENNVATCSQLICEATVCEFGYAVTQIEGKCCPECVQYVRDLYLNISESDYLNASEYQALNDIPVFEPFNITEMLIKENLTNV
ncbi:unnamed protein product [Lymnaea stagnalis]|uniref:VWFC domain-containing protein n=1 Tax=Lymnaea stagnalis TaxID=6523 RepID=A0AAV2HRY8_LYMST